MASATRPRVRPLSPHLSIWRWQANMTVSILHRATGNGLAFGGVVLFLWWLIAAATGPAAYATFYAAATGWFGIVVGVGLTWVFFQHLMSGIRHLVMDTGAAMQVHTSQTFAMLTFVASIVLTAATWVAIALTKGL